MPCKDMSAKDTARCLVHNSSWTVLTTFTAPDATFRVGFPYADTILTADSALNGTSTGRIFFMLVKDGTNDKNIKANPNTTVIFTAYSIGKCDQEVMDPTCARTIISGEAKTPTEPGAFEFAKNALFSRHPYLKELIKRKSPPLLVQELMSLCPFLSPQITNWSCTLWTSSTFGSFINTDHLP